jgi:copper oxidase (laccase) domain-containing protein
MDCRNYALHVGERTERVIQNRRELAKALGFPFSSWTCGEQVHGVHVSQVTNEDRGKGSTSRETAFKDTDGLITEETDILLTAFFADCVPLYFYCPDVDAVGLGVIEPLKQSLKDPLALERVSVSHVPGKWRLDLRKANFELLKQSGVNPNHILVTKWCTSCDKEYFYSHRRDKGKTGRMVAWIGKKER